VLKTVPAASIKPISINVIIILIFNCYTCFLLTVQRYSDFHDSATIGYE
jgi:hypothetical protein